ncbi:MAG: outer membrane beta-barrel protein [Bryobacterales bacterium]|nr:outer membrane beta-barrel protein [Bryobacterales bacterium]
MRHHHFAIFWIFLGVAGFGLPAFGQDFFGKYNITVGAGAAVPQQDLKVGFTTAPNLNVGFGYRFARNFQLDTGFETAFGAADIRTFVRDDQLGLLEINDRQYFVPFGGRAILPLGESGRFEVFGGGGGNYMRYSEVLRQPSDYFRVPCTVCSSRSGWGYYGLVGFRGALNRGRNFWVGMSSKVVRGNTNGQPLGDLPATETKDRWTFIQGEFSFAF